MNIGILTIGNELTSGRISDTNSALIARAVRARDGPWRRCFRWAMTTLPFTTPSPFCWRAPRR